MTQLNRTSTAALVAVSIAVCAPRAVMAQEQATSHERSAASIHVPRASIGSASVPLMTVVERHDDITPVRRQPKHLLDGIALTRAEKKAVYGIIRRNARTLNVLEERGRSAGAHSELHAQLERDIATVRDRERAEIRAVLDPRQRVRFDRNVERLGETIR